MKRIRIVGFALVAVFALSAMGASAVFGATLVTSEWLTSSGGSPAGITITGKGGLSFFQSPGGNKVECEKSETKGEFLSSTDADVKVTYSGNCALSGTLSGECKSVITTNELLVTPASADNSATLRLVVILPVSGSLVTENFTCGEVVTMVYGGVICHVPKFALSTTGEIVCHQVANGKQEYTLAVIDETLITDFLTAEASFSIFKIEEPDAQNTTEVLTYSSAVEQMEGAGS
jgi:hypothetical protein